jgi:hypothetical protein
VEFFGKVGPSTTNNMEGVVDEDVHEVIGAMFNILGVLFGVPFGVLMEYSTQKFHQFHQYLF